MRVRLEPQPNVVLTMTMDEAKLLRKLFGPLSVRRWEDIPRDLDVTPEMACGLSHEIHMLLGIVVGAR